jgi:O-antigen/teichoic acid export membrane protein
MFAGQGANFALQAASFILLARFLGVTEYGIFAGAFALTSIVTPYSLLGASMLFMRYVSVDRRLARVYWGNALVIVFLISGIFVLAASYAGPAFTGIHSRWMFVVLMTANCFFAQIAGLASTVFQTFEKMRNTAILSFVSNLMRLLILLILQAWMHHATAEQWSMGVLLASVLAALLSFVTVTLDIGWPTFSFNLMRQRIVEGVGFSFAGTTQAVYNDVDKTMLSHYGLNRENGFYSLAYKIVDFSTSPMFAIAAAILPRLFRGSHENKQEVIRLAFKAALYAAFIGVVIAGGTLLVAPVVPRIVGRDFSGVLVALHWLCWIPLLRGIHFMTGSALTGLGHQKLRTAAQFTVAGVNILLNLWWIPVYGWIGAAWSSVAADGLLAILNVLLLLWLWTRLSREEAQTKVGVAEL